MLPLSKLVTEQPSEFSLASIHIAANPLQLIRSTQSTKLSIIKDSSCRIPPNTSTVIQYKDVRLGLRGGSPMWPVGGGNNREPWPMDQKQSGGRDPDVNRKHCSKGRGQNASTSNTSVPGGGSSSEDLEIARAKVASLVAADYNDFDDENSQLTPPDTKTGGRNPSLDVEISTELELLAESENIVIVDHMSDDNIVAGSDLIEECIVSTSSTDLVDSKEKIEQVVEEDEQHVVMMIEENTLTASFSVEQGDKLMSTTIVRKIKPVDDTDAARMSGVGGNGANVCATSYLNENTVGKTSRSCDVQGESRSVNTKPLASVIQTPSLTSVVDENPNKYANTPSIIDSQGAMNLVQKRTSKERTDSAEHNRVNTDVVFVDGSLVNNSALEDLDMNSENVNKPIVLNESIVLDLSTTVQDCTKVEAEGDGVAQGLDEGKEENANRQAASSKKITPSTSLPINKALKEVGQMLLVADSPESPDQQEMNIDPSPEPSFHEFDSLFNKLGQGTEHLTMSSAKHREIFTTHLPKDTSVSVRAKESISALLKEEPKKSVETNSNVVSLSGSRGVACVPVTPAVACPTKPKPSSNIDTVAVKPTLSDQQNFIVSRGAVSISLLDPSASSSIASPYISKSSSNKPDLGVSDVVSIQRHKRPDQLVHKEKTMAATETSVVPVYHGDQCMPVMSTSGSLDRLVSQTTGAMNLGQPSLVCSALSTVTISVITTTPRVSSHTPTDFPTTSTTTTSSTPTETQPSSSYTNKNTPGVKSKSESPSTTQSLQATIAGSVPSSSACTLSVINTGETYVPLSGIASSAQVSQLLNLPARSLQTLIENNQLFKSCPSTSQGRNVLVSSTQSLSEPILSAHEGIGTKSLHAPVEIQAMPKCSETREDGSLLPHVMPIQYHGRNSEASSHLGEKTKVMPGFDVTSKFLDQSKSTTQQNYPVNITKTTSQVHPQIVSVLESRLMSSSEYSYQQTPVTTSTSSGSLQPDIIRNIPSQMLYSRQVPNTVSNICGMATNTTNIITCNPIQSVSTQSSSSVPNKGNISVAPQQSSPVTPSLNIKEEKLDDNITSGCALTSTPDVINHSSCKISSSNRLEESQNVLLKQLLQNTGCAQTQSTISVPSLEAQLAQPVPSTPSALLSPLLLDTVPPVKLERSCMPVSRTPSREDMFSPLPSPKREAPPAPAPQASPRREVPPLLTSPKRETPLLLVSPKREVPPPQASPKREPSPRRESPASLMSPKREVPLPQASPNKEMQLGLVEIKKEVMEETERKTELGHIPDQSPSDIKKMKRRQYQQKRRQSQGKEAVGGPSKKRQKKVTTVEEDWDTYMENLMQNLQQLPSIHVQEPSLPSNPIVGIIFGAGDLTKLADGNASGLGELHGTYGNANLFQVSDYYDSKPFGPCIPLPPPLPVSTQRGFYDQEFAPLKFGIDSEDKKNDAPARDFDSPQSVISSSSPECLFPDTPIMFPGLRLINPDSDEEDSRAHMSSPVLPLLAPVPIRLAPVIKELEDVGKENKGSIDDTQLKSRPLTGIPLRDSGNVAVTLTLSSAAADDIVGVLRDLANFLHIPPPSSYQIVERTNTPPSQKLGLYRCKGKDGKEGAPIDIQSILNGEAKFCRHCDVVILNNSIKKKVSDLPFLAKDDIPDNEDFLNFCSTSCYMQFALMHRLPSITQDKVAATVDHLCQSEVSVKAIKIKTEVKSVSSDDPNKLSEGSLCSGLFEKGVNIEKPSTEVLSEPGTIKVKSVCYKTWSPGALQPTKKMKKTTDREMTELLFRMGITVMPPKIPEDTRSCIFCHHIGDGIADGPARLLNYDVDRWVHLNCALWSDDVYETVNGALMNLDNALKQSLTTSCVACHKNGASIRCFKLRCSNVYHLSCAVKSECVFFKNKTMYCTAHIPKNEKDNELTTLAVFRRVYVDRDENRQVASVMHRSDHNHLMRVGSLIFLNVGQLLPHQLQAFHTCNCIYPIGYKIVRFYWSMRVHNKRCRYVCTIHDVAGRPEFRVLVQEPNQDDLELRDSSPKAVWARILEPMALMRKEMGGIQVFPRFVSGEDLFGLTEPAIVRILESLPGVESMNDYRFKYGRNPLLELPLAVNPTGSARSEPKLRIAYPWKRPHTQRTATSSRPVFVPTATVAGEAACPYSKQFVHSKSSQYKKMKQDWRNNVYLARSKIQGLGLYAARDLERHTMVIEYIGEVIRTELSELREKLYEARNRGIYMFRLDEERVVDATLSGGLARYINHSCNPNCVAEIVEVDRDLRIIIFAKKRISRGEELAYDYKFDIEDDQHKIPCNCGAANCKKWMN